jgi:hypothetical protein
MREFESVTSLAAIVTVPVTSSPETTAPRVEIVNEPLGFRTMPAGTPVSEPSGNPHDAGAEKQSFEPLLAPTDADDIGALAAGPLESGAANDAWPPPV